MAYRHLSVEQKNAPVPLSRRDFLRLHVSEGKRVLELSCERLFMRYQDAQSGVGRRQISNHDDVTPWAQQPTGFDTPTLDELFAEFERQLAEVDELCVLEPDWLNGGAFGREVGVRVEAFERRGGHVAFGSFSPPSVSNGNAES